MDHDIACVNKFGFPGPKFMQHSFGNIHVVFGAGDRIVRRFFIVFYRLQNVGVTRKGLCLAIFGGDLSGQSAIASTIA